MQNFDRENIDELLEIRQIRQYFAPYDNHPCNSLDTVMLLLTFDSHLILISQFNSFHITAHTIICQYGSLDPL